MESISPSTSIGATAHVSRRAWGTRANTYTSHCTTKTWGEREKGLQSDSTDSSVPCVPHRATLSPILLRSQTLHPTVCTIPVQSTPSQLSAPVIIQSLPELPFMTLKVILYTRL